MRNIYNYSDLGRRKLQQLIDEVAEMRNLSAKDKASLEQKWSSEKDGDELTAKIISCLSMYQLTDSEFERLDKAIHRVKPPWKLIQICLFLIFLLAVGVLYFNFRKLPRVYCFSNNIPVYTNLSTSAPTNDQMDIFGEKFSVGNPETSPSREKMIMLGSAENMYKVMPDNFFVWLFRNFDTSYVRMEGVTLEKDKYDRYKAIFKALRGDKSLLMLEPLARSTIADATNNENYPYLKQSIIADDIPASAIKEGFSRILAFNHPAYTINIYLRLQANNSYYNTLIQHDIIKNEFLVKKISKRGFDLNDPGVFRKDPPPVIPSVLFRNSSNGKTMESIDPANYSIFQDIK